MSYTPKSAKTELANFMRPMGKSLYPSSDITSIVKDGSDPAYSSQKAYHFEDAGIDERWRYNGTWYDVSNNPINQISGATASEFGNVTSYEVEFYVSGDRFAVWTVSVNTKDDFKIFVDDMPLENGWQFGSTSAFGVSYYKVQFASSKVRKVRCLMSGFLAFTGILTPGASAIWKAPPRFRVAITGDSYVQGGHYVGTDGWLMGGALCNQVAILTGWEVINLGQGGTGYVNNSGGTAGKSEYGSSSRMTALAALPSLDLFMSFGGGNDSATTEATVVAAANSFWNAVKTARPTTPIVVVGVESGSPTGFTPSLMDSTNTALINAAKANQSVAGTIDMRTDPWVTGTGWDGTPDDNGNADFFISSDEVHPTRAGYENMALRIVSELQRIKI